jgi:flavin reductase (DIM6/NTAB) family NADH-FMN oxidoreductase RutF
MSITEDTFKELMKRFASGVTLITFENEGKYSGLTVSSFCSLSMDPPLILICIDKNLPSHNSLKKGNAFGVNICNSEQGKLAWDFANSKIDKNELILSQNHEITGRKVPLLKDCLASMECTMKEAYDGGDHTIFVGQIENGNFDEKTEALIYYKSGLGNFKPN